MAGGRIIHGTKPVPDHKEGLQMNQYFHKIALTACSGIILFAPAAAYAKQRHHFARVEVLRNTTAMMRDGTRLHVQVVKMNGHMMAEIPMNEMHDYLHQQIFLPEDR
jgi:hypothetical protein